MFNYNNKSLMRNKIFLLILCALTATSYVFANDSFYFPDGMKWTMDSWKQEGAIVNHNISICTVQGDTLINGEKYRNIKQNDNFTVPIRQDEKKLYVHLNDSDYLLYDFGVEEGDTVPAYDGYDPNHGLIPSPSAGSGRVVSIDTVILLDGQAARQIIYENRAPDIEYVTCPVWLVLDPMYVNICNCMDEGQIMCCSHNGEPVYEFNQGDCEKLDNLMAIDITSIANSASIKILYDGLVLIERNGKVYTLQGQEVK